MQKLAPLWTEGPREDIPPERRRAALTLLAIAIALLGAGCDGDGNFSAAELATLHSLTLGPVPPSPSNRLADSPGAAALGQLFFYDTRFSGPLRVTVSAHEGGLGNSGDAGRVACASCHDPSRGGADVRSRGATSLGADWTGRNAPSVFNTAYRAGDAPWQFWDGRKDSLWSQALGPIESPVEHNSSRLQVAHLIAQHYKDRYEALFGPLPDLSDGQRFPSEGHPGTLAWEGMGDDDRHSINTVFANFGKAIEAYERLLVDRDAPLDRYLAGDRDALSAEAIRGARLFIGRASCLECHRGPTLSAHEFVNHAIPQVGPHVLPVDRGRAEGVRRVSEDEFNQAGPYSDHVERAHLDGLSDGEDLLGTFLVPPLRGVSRTAPYMHTGGLPTLWDVLAWYRDAAGTDGFVGTRDAAIHPLLLSNEDLNDLVAFLKALDGAPLPTALTTAPVLP